MAEKGFRCPACGGEFESRERLEQHAKQQHQHGPAPKQEPKR